MELKFEKFHDDQFNSFLFDFRRKKNVINKKNTQLNTFLDEWFYFGFAAQQRALSWNFFFEIRSLFRFWHSTCAFACLLNVTKKRK